MGARPEERAAHPEQIRIYRSLTPARRLELALALSDLTRELKAAGLKDQHPDWTEEQIKEKVREIFLYAWS